MPAREHTAFIGLGSNLENPREQVRRAVAALEALPASRNVRSSSLYQTDPVGFADQPAFINAVAALETSLEPESLLSRLREIETTHGRLRGIPNGPRTLDLDLLLYGDITMDSAAITLPHPRMHERAFVLVPLLELAPDAEIPGKGRADVLLTQVAQQGVARAA
jgi:2-amino-4-hydroxy-6-hydroxymethyldihydropteridine diphosphokinase